MRIDSNNISKEKMQELVDKINAAADKGAAIVEATAELCAMQDNSLVEQIVQEAARARSDESYRESLGLRQLSKEETEFFQRIKDGPEAYKQAVTADQKDILPIQTIDRTMEDVKKSSGLLSSGAILYAPAGVKRWITASATGVAVWGPLTAAIEGEISAAIDTFDTEVNKLMAFIPIPKAIRDLEIGYVEKYLRAKLAETMEDGMTKGYLYGTGKNEPIGIAKKLDESNQDGTKANKTKVTTLEGFSPKQIAPIKVTLCNNGKRKIPKLILICNPLDRYQYVDPAIYGDTPAGGYVRRDFLNMDIYEDTNVTTGDGFLTIPGHYTMGLKDVRVDEYKETRAMDDVDVLIAKAYANGQADDNNVAVVFDITKLKEYVPTFQQIAAAAAATEEEEGNG